MYLSHIYHNLIYWVKLEAYPKHVSAFNVTLNIQFCYNSTKMPFKTFNVLEVIKQQFCCIYETFIIFTSNYHIPTTVQIQIKIPFHHGHLFQRVVVKLAIYVKVECMLCPAFVSIAHILTEDPTCSKTLSLQGKLKKAKNKQFGVLPKGGAPQPPFTEVWLISCFFS